MVIIGISGGSGAGKSTVSRGLARILPNTVFIDVDVYVREATEKLEDEIYKRLGIEKEDGKYMFNVTFASHRNMIIWIDTIKDYVNNRIEEVVEKIGDGKDYVIVDWCYLPMCDFYNKCNFTMCVKADCKTRYERLYNRMKDIKEYSIETGPSVYDYEKIPFENRVKYSALDEYGYPSKYVIKNDQDMETLNKCVSYIANALESINRPERYFEFERENKTSGGGFVSSHPVKSRNYSRSNGRQSRDVAIGIVNTTTSTGGHSCECR